MSLNVLVTGSRGYIGTNLRKFYKEKQCLVTQVVDPNIVEMDIAFDGYCISDKNLDDYNFDIVVHLAALSGIKACDENPQELFRSNIRVPLKLIDYCYSRKIPFIFASSIGVIGASQYNWYAQSKYFIENEIIKMNNKSGRILGTSLRFANVYGGQDYLEKKQTFIANLMKAKKDGSTLTIADDGNQKRDFIHVDEICKVIDSQIRLYLRNDSLPSHCSEIATGKQRSLNEVLKICPVDVVYTMKKSHLDGFAIETEKYKDANVSVEDKLEEYLKVN